MPYTVRITSNTPACFIFLIDQSGSMSKPSASNPEKTLAQGVADAVNRLLHNLVLTCVVSEGLKDRFYVSVIRYGRETGSALGKALSGRAMVSISELGGNVLGIAESVEEVVGPSGRRVPKRAKQPFWIEPAAAGKTPMCAALEQATVAASHFLNQFPDCFPPIVMNITDGDPTDGDPRPVAQQLCDLASSDGNILLLNLHISADAADPIRYPALESPGWDKYARLLFRMSSRLPDSMLAFAAQQKVPVSAGSRGFAYNADLSSVVQFLDVGTQTQIGLKG